MAKRSKNQNTLRIGDWNVICDVCGFKYKASDIRKRWDNLYVCEDDWEPRHPMDFQKGFEDDPSVPFSRTDTVEEAVVQIDDETISLVGGSSPTIYDWNTAFTASRVAQLGVLGTDTEGDRFTIYKTTSHAAGFIFRIFS